MVSSVGITFTPGIGCITNCCALRTQSYCTYYRWIWFSCPLTWDKCSISCAVLNDAAWCLELARVPLIKCHNYEWSVSHLALFAALQSSVHVEWSKHGRVPSGVFVACLLFFKVWHFLSLTKKCVPARAVSSSIKSLIDQRFVFLAVVYKLHIWSWLSILFFVVFSLFFSSILVSFRNSHWTIRRPCFSLEQWTEWNYLRGQMRIELFLHLISPRWLVECTLCSFTSCQPMWAFGISATWPEELTCNNCQWYVSVPETDGTKSRTAWVWTGNPGAWVPAPV